MDIFVTRQFGEGQALALRFVYAIWLERKFPFFVVRGPVPRKFPTRRRIWTRRGTGPRPTEQEIGFKFLFGIEHVIKTQPQTSGIAVEEHGEKRGEKAPSA